MTNPTVSKNQCPNCGSFKTWRRGRTYLWGGLIGALLSLPWLLIVVGIIGLVGALVLAGMGAVEITKGDPLRCKQCKWSAA